ncbi:MAG: aryl-sulfate sulfotransferase, partial [Myxococcales bacterium]|nr:aryl-sulfate sulfotransferase [Myxococcales bacterium]
RGFPTGEEVRWAVTGTDADGRTRWSEWRTWRVPDAPEGLPELTLEVAGDPGFRYLAATVIFADQVGSAVVIVDAEGRYVWWTEPGEVALTPELRDTEGGPVMGWMEAAADRDVDAAAFVEVPLSGARRTRTPLAAGHHDAAVLPGGELAFLAMAFEDHELDGVGVPMVSDEVRLTTLGASEAAPTDLLWSTFADMPVAARGTCDHIRQPTSRLGRDGVREWTHANSLVHLADEDTLLVGARYTDWLYAIDDSTGELRWVLNGLGSDFVGPDDAPVWRSPSDTDLWSHAHLSDAWSGGAMVFDNGDHHQPPVSVAMEVAWDASSRTAEVVWSRPHPDGGATGALGDVRRVGDDVLVSWAGLGTVEVVGRDQTTRWRLGLSDGMFARVLPIDALR